MLTTCKNKFSIYDGYGLIFLKYFDVYWGKF